MPRIRFTTAPKLPRDWAHLGYRRGTEVELSPDQAERWLRRGVAVIIPDAPVAAEEVASAEPVEAGDDETETATLVGSTSALRFKRPRKAPETPSE